MAFYDESDPNIAPDEYQKFPKGEVVVSGIYSFVYNDDQNMPFYKERDGRPQTMFRLRLADGSEGPPMSGSPADMALLIVAFAGEQFVSKLPANKTSANYLLTAKKLINCETEEQTGMVPKRQTAYVSEKGFVSNLSGMSLPTDRMFRFALDDIRNLDGTTTPLRFMTFQAYRDAEVMNLRFRVVGDMMGNPTIYDGAAVRVMLENPFAGVYEGTNAEGMTVRQPKFKVNENRSQPRSVSRIKRFIEIFCPELMQAESAGGYSWVSDPTRSSYGTDEAANPIVVIADHALRGRKIALGKLSVSEKSKNKTPRLDLAELMPVDGGATTQPAVPKPSDDEARDKLYSTIREIVLRQKNAEAFKPGTVEWSEAGLAWAKEILAPVWSFLKLPEPRALGVLDAKQADALCGMLLSLDEQKGQTAPAADPNLNKPVSEF